MRTFKVLGSTILLVCGMLTTLAPAQGPPPASPPPAPAPRPGGPSVEDLTQDLKREDGLFTLFYYVNPDPSKDSERLLALIPSRIMNQDLLLATSLSQGGTYTGWMWDDYLIRFEIRSKQLLIVLPEVRYPVKAGDPVAEMVQKTYKARILATAPILAQQGGDALIDLGPLLKSNLAGLPMGGGVRGDLSKWMKKKVFPDNILLEVELALGFGQGINLTGVAYAFRSLPPLGQYQPRGADDRVGYFLTARLDWTKKHDVRETFDRYINRWQLVKRDSNLELSPPRQPITFIIEKTVPIQWRRYVRQGIEMWNLAFEKIGYTGAVQVLQQESDNDLSDIDPEDARYNFFRWIVSGNPFAMGPSRTDPRTGQILDADIIFDDSMVRSWIQDFTNFTSKAVAEAKGPGFREFQKRHPNLRIPGGQVAHMDAHLDEGTADSAAETRRMVEGKFAARGQRFCDFSIGFQHQIAMAFYVMSLRTGNQEIPEKLIGEAIREVVAHEVGHTLGLRHNFKASSWLTVEEIQKRRGSDEPTSASVMDYNPILFFHNDPTGFAGHFVTPTIGPYDYWAIEYGYKTPGKGDKPEEEMLKSIASRCAEPGLAYATDEDTMWVYSPDPHVGRFDMSADPFRWAKERIALVDSLLGRVADIAALPGESRYHLTRAFEALLWEKGTVLEVVSRWVGGQHFHRDHQGDPSARPPFVIVPAARQREALKIIRESLFRDSFFAFSPDLLNMLAPPRWMHWGASTSYRLDYPIHDRIRMMQWWTMTDVLSSPVLRRVYDAELKSSEPEKFTASELLSSLRDAVWAPIQGGPPSDQHSAARPYLSSVTRGLQREHLEILLDSVLSPADGEIPPDLHAMVCGTARELSASIGKTLGGNTALIDDASRAHLQECRSRLERALEAQFQRRG